MVYPFDVQHVQGLTSYYIKLHRVILTINWTGPRERKHPSRGHNEVSLPSKQVTRSPAIRSWGVYGLQKYLFYSEMWPNDCPDRPLFPPKLLSILRGRGRTAFLSQKHNSKYDHEYCCRTYVTLGWPCRYHVGLGRNSVPLFEKLAVSDT